MALSDSYLPWLQQDTDRMAAIDPTMLETPVPSCPRWDVKHVVAHTSWVHRYWTHALRHPEGQEAKMADVPPWPDDVDIVTWVRDGLTDLVSALHDTPPSKSVWSVLGVYPASFVRRRVVHETAIHRWDAQAAVGEPDGFEPALAADGIDEMFEVWVPLCFDYSRFGAADQTIHLHGTDVEGEWLVTVKDDTTEMRHAHEPADVTVRGPLGDLYLLSWNRLEPSSLDVAGDHQLLSRWRAAAIV